MWRQIEVAGRRPQASHPSRRATATTGQPSEERQIGERGERLAVRSVVSIQRQRHQPEASKTRQPQAAPAIQYTENDSDEVTQNSGSLFCGLKRKKVYERPPTECARLRLSREPHPDRRLLGTASSTSRVKRTALCSKALVVSSIFCATLRR